LRTDDEEAAAEAVSGDSDERDRRPSVTVEDLERWTDHGAVWRALEITDELAVVELCTCYGEPVDVVEGAGPELVAYVREHKDEAS
jgi:hypothetical protein